MSDASGWRCLGPLQRLRQRAFLCAQIRSFFAARSVTEVVTPVLSAAGNTDVQIEVFSSDGLHAEQSGSYLRTSPEFFHKRLLASGSGDIFEIAQVFRKAELSPLHNPEFTMLEWYRLGFQWSSLAAEVTELINVLRAAFELPVMQVCSLSYQQLFVNLIGLDPFAIDEDGLNEVAIAHGYHGAAMERVTALDFLFAIAVEPRLEHDQGYLIHDFPIEQAALAAPHPEYPDRCLRFEFLWGGVELANGYQELTDATEQRRRFERDNQSRLQSGKPTLPVDEHLLAAIDAGLPACSGVALGVDRLLMCLLDCDSIHEVMPFNAGNS